MRSFAVFDIDGTLIRWQLYHSLVDELAHLGVVAENDYAELKNSRMTWKRREHPNTFQEYQSVVVKVFSRSLEKINEEEFKKAVDSVYERYKDQVYTYTRDLITKLKSENYLLFAISGSHQEIIQKLATHYGFDEAIGNTYEKIDGKFTGKHQDIVGRKPELLKQLVKNHGASYQGSVAIGDSASDASLLKIVEEPTAFNPDSGLLKIAQSNDWPIVIERKNVVYELKKQGSKYELVTTNPE